MVALLLLVCWLSLSGSASASVLVDYDCSTTPDAPVNDFTTLVAGGASWTSDGSELYISVDSTQSNNCAWFGSYPCLDYCDPTMWSIPDDTVGTYAYVRARVSTSARQLYWYVRDDAFVASVLLRDASTVLLGCATGSDTVLQDNQQTHSFEFWLHAGNVKYAIDGATVFDGPARVETGARTLLIGDGNCATSSGYGTLILDHVRVVAGVAVEAVGSGSTAGLRLDSVRPNPSANGFVVGFSLASWDQAVLELIDVTGRCIFRREVGPDGPGEHVLRVQKAVGLRPGVYLLRLTSGGWSVAKKAVVMRE